MSYYKYSPLPKGWIRLLQIHDVPQEQGRKASDNRLEEDDLESALLVTLQAFPLSDCPQYVALSYTWGEPTKEVDPTTIIFTVESRCYPIQTTDRLILRGTRNLRAALRHIRQARASFRRPPLDSSVSTLMNREALNICGTMNWFWVDALCIDQDNLTERADQVACMRQIYQQSHVCIAWLGEADASSQVTERLLWDISARSARVDPQNRQRMQQAWIETISDRDTISLAVTFARNWFSRIWVLQEVLLAPYTVALWGSTSFSFLPLVELNVQISTFRMIRTMDISQVSDMPSTSGTEVGATAFATASLHPSMRSLLRCKQDLSEYSVVPKFYNVMEMSWQRLCVDPRDRIYGLLGVTREFLSSSGESVIDVDYTLPVETVYIEATAAVAKYGQHLDFLIFVCKPEDRNHSTLPSWCPDYSVTKLLPDFNHVGPSLWSPEPTNCVIDNRLLEVKGVLFDIVGSTYRPDDEEGSLSAGVRKVVALLQLAASTRRPDCVEPLANMLLMDQMDISGPAPPVAAILLPLGLIDAMKIPFPLTGNESDSFVQENSAALSEALDRLYEAIDLLQEGSQNNKPYLPNIELIRQAFQETLRRGWSSIYEVNTVLESILMAEHNTIDERAREIGLLDKLLQHLGGGPRQQPLQQITVDAVRTVRLSPFVEKMLLRMSMNLNDTTFFLTRRMDRLGFGYCVQEGDEIWVLHGSLAPVLLQRCSDTVYYEFRGQIYVSGIMQGEICEERDRWLGQTRTILIQ